MALMIPQSTHAQRAKYNQKHGAGAWGQKIGKDGVATIQPVGGPMTQLPTPTNITTAPAPVNPNVPDPRPRAPAGPASAHATRAAYNQVHGAGMAKNATGHQLRQAYNQVHGPNAYRTGAVAQPAAPAPAPVTPAPAAEPQMSNPDPNPAVDPNELAKTLFPGARMFEPGNYEGSPLYQFQLKAGQDQVAKSLAKRGLTNSGAAIKEELNVPMMAAAQDTERMTRVAMDNAGRLERMQGNEAMRQERAGNTQWDRQLSLAQLMAQQSPWDAAVGAVDASAGATESMGQSQANFLRDYYQRLLGGGGSAGVPIQRPSGPDYSSVGAAQINGNMSSNNGWLDLITKTISGLV